MKPGDQFRYGNITLELVRQVAAREEINGTELSNLSGKYWLAKTANTLVLCDVTAIEDWITSPQQVEPPRGGVPPPPAGANQA